MPSFADATNLERDEPDKVNVRSRATPLEFLQAVYRNEGIPLSVRMKAAIEALPFAHPKLAVTAMFDGNDFAHALEQAAARSRAVMQRPQPRAIEHASAAEDN
jgi:hypothetical protein